MAGESPPSTTLSPDEAADLCSHWFSEPVHVTPLYGEFDQNVRVETASNERFVLKIMRDSSDATRSLVELQVAMLMHLAECSLEITCSRPVPALSGEDYVSVVGPSGVETIAWLLTYVDGEILDSLDLYDDGLLRSLGRAVAVVDRALLNFSDPRAERSLLWDLANALSLRSLVRLVPGIHRRDILIHFFDRLVDDVLPRLAARPTSVIHNDGGNQHNMIVGQGEDGSPRVTGIIDFGDALKSHTICGLGIAAAYATFGCEDPVWAAARVAAGYDEVLPLDSQDLDLVLPLAATRLTMSVSIAARRANASPDDAYASVSREAAWGVLAKLHELDFDRATDQLRESVHETD